MIAYRNGAPVHLRDVATAAEGAENDKLQAWVDRTPAIVLNVQRQPGANVIAVVDSIKALLPSLSAGLPPAMVVRPITDRTVTIRASVADVEFELGVSILLVVAVIFLFLRDVPATLIPALSVPLSLVGTLAVMYLYGFSLDNLSLMALTVATGFVVDDSIVMIENIARYVEMGRSPLAAALEGAGQIGFTIISLTVSLLAVLIPLLFMGDVVGRLFHEFAITLAVTIVISAVVSLTLVPMLCARLLRARAEERAPSRLGAAAGRAFDGLIGLYSRALDVVLDHAWATLLVAGATLALTVLLYVAIPKGFFPVQDTGLIEGVSQAAETTSYGAMAAVQQRLATRILADPDVLSLTSFIGVDGTNTTLNAGRFLINLRPRDGRASAAQISRRLQDDTAGIAGARLFLQPVQDLAIDTAASATQYQLVLTDVDPAEFKLWVPRMVARLQALPELADVASDLQASGLGLSLVIDRPTAARFGITPATVDNALYDAFGQRIVSTIFTQSNQYRVILQADSALAPGPAALEGLYLPSSTATNGQVPLSAIVHVSTVPVPLVVSHVGQFPATTISFNLAPGASLGAAPSAITNAERALDLPASLQSSFEGAAAAFQSSLDN